jgi:transcriptional regulator with XRE-family HTH domain
LETPLAAPFFATAVDTRFFRLNRLSMPINNCVIAWEFNMRYLLVMLLKELGNRIRLRREKRGLKQQDIANALDISPQAVSKWERGENAPDIAVLEPLARLLDVSVDWLLTAREQPKDTFDAAVLVSSIHGAHEKALQMRPRDFALWANGMFYQLTEICLGYEGVPIKYMGDEFLCFFAGIHREERAFLAALRARSVIAESLVIGLSRGEVYLGSVGHPDYARPDIMGEVVNIAFLTQDWADKNAKSRMAATGDFVKSLPQAAKKKMKMGRGEDVRFRGVAQRVNVCELQEI